MTNIYINATNTDPRAKPGERWIQNTDGSDTYRSSRILYQDWLVQNGDDCLAFKGNSTQIVARNITWCVLPPGTLRLVTDPWTRPSATVSAAKVSRSEVWDSILTGSTWSRTY